MRQQNHVFALSPTGGAILPGEIAALADAENFAEPVNGEFLLLLIDEAEPHRLPSLAKKAVARFRISLRVYAGSLERSDHLGLDFPRLWRHVKERVVEHTAKQYIVSASGDERERRRNKNDAQLDDEEGRPHSEASLQRDHRNS